MRILCIDTAQALPHAYHLAYRGHTVYYFTPWQHSYATFRDFALGKDVSGIVKVQHWGEVIDSVDFVLIGDDTFGKLGSWLKKKGYNVVSAADGVILEQNRTKSKEILRSIGLKTPPYYAVKGVKGVEEFLQSKRILESSDTSSSRYYVKIDTFRGDMETLNINDRSMFECFKATIYERFGAFAEELKFTIEERVEGIETGADLFFNGERFVKPYMFGFEISCDYVGKWVEESIFEEELLVLESKLKELNYNGAFSFEVIYDGSNIYWLDIAARYPYPLSYIYPRHIRNYDELLFRISRGEDVTIDTRFEYSACVALENQAANTRWLPVSFKDGAEESADVDLYPIMNVNGSYVIVPYSDLIGAAIGGGNSAQEAIDNAEENAEKVNIWWTNYTENAFVKFQGTIESFESMVGTSF